MDLRAAILSEHSKANTIAISKWIGNDQGRFDTLMDLFLNDEFRVVQRAAWILSECAMVYTYLVIPHLESLLNVLEAPKHDAVLRNGLKVLAEVDIPNKYMGKAATISFDLLAEPKSPIAVRVFAMQVIANLCKEEPDLAVELKLLIEDHWEHASAGYKSRARRVLKQLEKQGR